MSEISAAFRADLDRELSGAIDALVDMAARHDGLDLIEANVELTNALLHRLPPPKLAAAAAALALRLHRSGADR